MPVTFRKRIKIFPGLYLNVGKKSMSLTTKIGPFAKTWSTSGRNTTSVNLPGPLGYRSQTTANGRRRAKQAELQGRVDAARARRDARADARRNRQQP